MDSIKSLIRAFISIKLIEEDPGIGEQTEGIQGDDENWVVKNDTHPKFILIAPFPLEIEISYHRWKYSPVFNQKVSAQA